MSNEKVNKPAWVGPGSLAARACLSVTTATGDKITVYPAPGKRTEEAVELVRRFIADGLGGSDGKGSAGKR